MEGYNYRLRYDAQGRIFEKTEFFPGRKNVWTYQYDTVGRLHEARLDGRLICQCHYDRKGRRVQDYFPHRIGHASLRYAYTLDDRLQSAGNNGYTHHKSTGARMIWKSAGKYTTYDYSPDLRLLRAEQEYADRVYEFRHDEAGRRVGKLLNGQPVEAYQWLDHVRLAGFHDGRARYAFVYNDGARVPYAMRRDDGKVFALHYDQVGSLRVVADASRNVIKEILYDPFGGVVKDTNPDLRIPIGFSGGLHDFDLGLVRFGWRDYDTFTGRWTAPDPMGDAGGDSDWYGYCLDDPVNLIDPLGLWAWAAAGAFAGAVVNGFADYKDYESGKISGAQYAGSIAIGAVTGALGPGLGSKVGNMLASAALSGINSAASQQVTKGEVDAKQVALDTGLGAVGARAGNIGSKIGEIAKGPKSSLSRGLGFTKQSTVDLSLSKAELEKEEEAPPAPSAAPKPGSVTKLGGIGFTLGGGNKPEDPVAEKNKAIANRIADLREEQSFVTKTDEVDLKADEPVYGSPRAVAGDIDEDRKGRPDRTGRRSRPSNRSYSEGRSSPDDMDGRDFGDDGKDSLDGTSGNKGQSVMSHGGASGDDGKDSLDGTSGNKGQSVASTSDSGWDGWGGWGGP